MEIWCEHLVGTLFPMSDLLLNHIHMIMWEYGGLFNVSLRNVRIEGESQQRDKYLEMRKHYESKRRSRDQS